MTEPIRFSGSLPGGVVPAPARAPRPQWLDRLAETVQDAPPESFSRFLPPREGGRQSAVLVLVGPNDTSGHDILLIERAHHLRSHAGQVAFPGGSLDPEDGGDVVAAALREATEETGVDPAGIEVVTVLPQLFLPPSGFVVTPVLGWWAEPTPVRAADPQEIAEVVLVPVSHLAEPQNRHTVVHHTGFRGVAFDVPPLVVWGFTASLLSGVLDLAGLARPWDESDERTLPERFARGSRYQQGAPR